MADTHVHEAKTEDVVVKAKDFWTQYQKPLLTIIIVLVALIGGWYGYKNYIVAPKETEAQNAMWKAEQYFREDSFQVRADRIQAHVEISGQFRDAQTVQESRRHRCFGRRQTIEPAESVVIDIGIGLGVAHKHRTGGVDIGGEGPTDRKRCDKHLECRL